MFCGLGIEDLRFINVFTVLQMAIKKIYIWSLIHFFFMWLNRVSSDFHFKEYTFHNGGIMYWYQGFPFSIEHIYKNVAICIVTMKTSWANYWLKRSMNWRDEVLQSNTASRFSVYGTFSRVLKICSAVIIVICLYIVYELFKTCVYVNKGKKILFSVMILEADSKEQG